MAAAARSEISEIQTSTKNSPLGEVEITLDDGVPQYATFGNMASNFSYSIDEHGVYTYIADLEDLQVKITGLNTEVFISEDYLFRTGHGTYVNIETDMEFGRPRYMQTSLADFIRRSIAMNTSGKIVRTRDEGTTHNNKIAGILVNKGIVPNLEIARLLVNYFSRNFTENMRGVNTYQLVEA